MQDWTEDVEGGEGRVDVEGDEHIGFGGGGGGEGERGWLLGVWGVC